MDCLGTVVDIISTLYLFNLDQSRYKMREKQSSGVPTQSDTNWSVQSQKKSRILFVCLFVCLLNVPVNSYFGHVGTLPPFYGTFTQNEIVMTSNKCLRYSTQV